jgi:hypothetical protein
MSHDKIKAAARQRMSGTGEPYTAARRAVVGERGAAAGEAAGRETGHSAGYRLAMSGEIHDWLAGFCVSQPMAAELAGRALATLIREGEELGAPLAVPAAASWRWALYGALDWAYQDRLERIQTVRRGHAEAATLAKELQDWLGERESQQARLDGERRRALDAGNEAEAERVAGPMATAEREASEMRLLLPGVTEACRQLSEASRWHQQRINDFRTRREVIKASFIAADAAIRIHQTLAGPGLADPGSDGQMDDPSDPGGAEARLRGLTAEMERELGHEPCPEELMELRPGAPESGDIRILFAAEPPGTALLIAVLEGPGTIEGQYRPAVAASAELLRQVRADQAPEASAHVYNDAGSFLAEFYPGRADSAGAGSTATGSTAS